MTPMFFTYKSGSAFRPSQHRPTTSTTLTNQLFRIHNVQIDLRHLLRLRALLHAGRTRPASGSHPDAYTPTCCVRRHVRQLHLLSQQHRVL